MVLKITAAAEDMEGKLDQEDKAIAAINEKFDALVEKLKKNLIKKREKFEESTIKEKNKAFDAYRLKKNKADKEREQLENDPSKQESMDRVVTPWGNIVFDYPSYHTRLWKINEQRSNKIRDLIEALNHECEKINTTFDTKLDVLIEHRNRALAAAEKRNQLNRENRATEQIKQKALEQEEAELTRENIFFQKIMAVTQENELMETEQKQSRENAIITPIQRQQPIASIANQESSSRRSTIPFLLCSGICISFCLLIKYSSPKQCS